jgi:hypothetical protein
MSVATSGATIQSEVTFYARHIYFWFLCLPYVYSNVELLRRKHQKTQHCHLFLLLLISNYFYFKNSEKKGTEDLLCTEGEILVSFLTLSDI